MSSELITYTRKGKTYTRAKGKTGTQAPVAKQQASILGKASGLSARIRKAIAPLLPDPKDRALMHRFNAAMQQFLRTLDAQGGQSMQEISSLKLLTFRPEEPMPDVALQLFYTDGKNLWLQVPAFDSPNPIAPLPFNGYVHMDVIAVSVNINQPEETFSSSIAYHIDYDGTPQPQKTFLLDIPSGEQYLTVIALKVNEQVSGIMHAFYGTQQV